MVLMVRGTIVQHKWKEPRLMIAEWTLALHFAKHSQQGSPIQQIN